MLNPFGSEQLPGSYVDLRKRMFKHIQDQKINDQIFEVVQSAYEKAITQENVVLSRPERTRLFAQILKMVLDDMAGKLK